MNDKNGKGVILYMAANGVHGLDEILNSNFAPHKGCLLYLGPVNAHLDLNGVISSCPTSNCFSNCLFLLEAIKRNSGETLYVYIAASMVDMFLNTLGRGGVYESISTRNAVVRVPSESMDRRNYSRFIDRVTSLFGESIEVCSRTGKRTLRIVK